MELRKLVSWMKRECLEKKRRKKREKSENVNINSDSTLCGGFVISKKRERRRKKGEC